MAGGQIQIPYGRNGRLRVHHFATSVFGGAAIAARRFFDSLQGLDIDSHFFAQDADPDASPEYYKIYRPKLPGGLTGRVQMRWMRTKLSALDKAFPGRPEGLEQFHHTRKHHPTPYPQELPAPDIVHLHWVSGLIDTPTFFSSIPANVPIVWTLHDMHPFTGGCHYAWECDRYKSTCAACPQLNGHNNGKAATTNQRQKQTAFANHRIHLAADSHWLAEEARKSTVFANAASVQAVHYGIDFNKFRPVDKAAARQQFKLPANVPVLAFGADSVDNKRKGLPELLEAINHLEAAESVHCIVFGRASEELRQQSRANLHFTGFVSDSDTQCAIYSAADAFVIPSLYEAFGQTSLEAMACETPVVGFNTGGIPDMVKPGKTGWLAERGNTQDLAAKLQQVLDDPATAQQLGKQARTFAMGNFSLELQLKKYMQLYARALGQ